MTIRKFIALVAGLVFLGGPLFGQSLGDVGRAQRQKQGDASTSQPAKVITNDDLGTSSSDSSHTRTKEKKNLKKMLSTPRPQFSRRKSRSQTCRQKLKSCVHPSVI